MKKTIAITSALAAVSGLATAEIKINDFLSFSGFVDMSYAHGDFEAGGSKDTSNSYAVDQVEIDWHFNADKVTARVDLEYLGSSNNFTARDSDGDDLDVDGVNVEQAYATYDLGNGLAVTAGRYQSTLGFEAFEPTGLYQYSLAYDMGSSDGNDNVGQGDVSVLPGYAQGVKLTKEAGGNVYTISLQDGDDIGRLGGDNNNGNSGYSVEASAAISLSDELGLFLGGAMTDNDADNTDSQVLNAYVTYETGAWTFAAEVVYGENEGGYSQGINDDSEEEVLAGLIMANYAYSDCCSITGRISHSDHETDNGAETDFTKYTLAHNYAVTDNLGVITEVSIVDGEGDYEATVGAVEVLFSF